MGFLSSSDWDLREQLMLPQESQVSVQVARGLSGFLSSQFRGICSHLELKLEPQVSYPGLTWILGFLWSFNRGVSPRLMWRHTSPLSSRAVKAVSAFCRVDIGISGFLSWCHRAVTTAIVLGANTRGDSRGSAGESGLSGVD